ncbi:MAG: hypothetical protein MJB57_12685, partial [Gemmatimonadetes bacterium]|nr:hypothetical protein [Gemmatimonadota bacterium]
GSYRGPGRGRRLNVTVSVGEDGRLHIRILPGEGQSVRWLGGDTFGAGTTRFEFRAPGPEGFAELRIDQVSGHYVLSRSTR